MKFKKREYVRINMPEHATDNALVIMERQSKATGDITVQFAEPCKAYKVGTLIQLKPYELKPNDQA
jgi:hypothetical protein